MSRFGTDPKAHDFRLPSAVEANRILTKGDAKAKQNLVKSLVWAHKGMTLAEEGLIPLLRRAAVASLEGMASRTSPIVTNTVVEALQGLLAAKPALAHTGGPAPSAP